MESHAVDNEDRENSLEKPQTSTGDTGSPVDVSLGMTGQSVDDKAEGACGPLQEWGPSSESVPEPSDATSAHDAGTLPACTGADLPATMMSTVAAPPDAYNHHRFSLLELFVAMTVAALALAVFRTLGIYGALLLFLLGVVFTLVIYPHQRADSPYRQGLMFDFVWGCVMPVVCLLFDPMVFKDDMHLLVEADLFTQSPVEQRVAENGNPAALQIQNGPGYLWSRSQVRNRAFLVYPLLAWQVIVLGLSLWSGKLRGPICGLMAGSLLVGGITAVCIGLMLALPAVVGIMVFGLGLLGLTPFFSAWAYFRAAMRAYEQIHQSGAIPELQRNRLLALAGIFASIFMPLVGGYMLLVVLRGESSFWRIFFD